MAKIMAIGHRGAKGICPENTRAAFLKAVELGCDAVELDVQLTADGGLVVIHDATLDRTTDGRGPVAARTLEDLRRLDAGGGERIPTLDEVLELLSGGPVRIQIELKGPDTQTAAARIVRERGMGGRVTFTSFHHRRVLEAGRLCPGATRGLLVTCSPIDPVALLATADADNLHVNHERIDGDLVRLVHGGGKRIMAWGNIVAPEVMDRLVALGVDGIGSDRPDLLLERLGRLPQSAQSRP